MKTKLIIFLFVLFSSCTTFSKMANKIQISAEDDFVKVYNSELKIKFLTFRDFKFATNIKDFKSLNHKILHFRNILFYGKTTEPNYEYYVLLNPKTKKFNSKKFDIKDTIINNNNVIVLISKDAPKKDIQFIKENIYTE